MKSEEVHKLRDALRVQLSFLPGYPVDKTPKAVLWKPARSTHRSSTGGTILNQGKDELISIDRDQISNATAALKLATSREMEDALAHVVDEPEAWKAGMERLLDLLKQSVHGNEPFPLSPLERRFSFKRKGFSFKKKGFSFKKNAVSKAKDLVRSYPELQPLINAMAWQYCLNPTAAGKAFDWIEKEAPYLSGIVGCGQPFDGITLSMYLYSLELLQPDRNVTHPILCVLSNPVAFDIPTSFEDRYVWEWLRLLDSAADRTFHPETTFPRKPSSFADELIELLEWTAMQSDTKLSERTLRLSALIFPDDILADWSHWWSAVDAWTRKVNVLLEDLSRYSHHSKQRSHRGKKKQRWERLLSKVVVSGGQNAKQTIEMLQEQGIEFLNNSLRSTSSNDYQTFRAIRNLASLKMTSRYVEGLPETVKEPEKKNCFKKLCSMLENIDNLPPGILPRAKTVCVVADFYRAFRPRDFERVVRYLMGSRVSSKHWPNVLEDHFVLDHLEDSIRNDLGLKQAFEYLAFWTEDLNQDRDLGWPFLLASVLDQHDKWKQYLTKLTTYSHRAELQKNRWQHRALFGMAEYCANVEQFLELVRLFEHGQVDTIPIRNLTLRVHGELRNAGWPNLVAELLLTGKRGRLEELDDASTLLAAFNDKSLPPGCPEGEPIPDWALKYPREVHRDAAILDSLDHDAETVVLKAWNRAVPGESTLRKEIDALRRKVANNPGDSRLSQGLVNKQSQLRKSSELVERRTKVLKKRLAKLIPDRVCDVWHQSLWNKIEQHINEIIDGTNIPAEWRDGQLHRKTRRILVGIFSLDGWARDLAVRLLRIRLSGPTPPWDVNGDPQNQRFLATMAGLGINTKPWLSGFVRSVTTTSGEQLILAIEQDPLEIFYMGGYFDTCLSPGAFNFFSTVSVAADVNKQVLFARNKKGEVVGRCLLALARNGGLLVFRTYSFLDGNEFSDITAEYVTGLAQEMNTTVQRMGDIDCLVAAEWYDDGPHAICDRLPCFWKGSGLRCQLATVALGDLLPLLRRELSPLKVNDVTLPLIVQLPEFAERPELVLPLKHIVSEARVLPTETSIQIAQHALKAGDRRFAMQVIQSHVLPFNPHSAGSVRLFSIFRRCVQDRL